MTPETGNPAKAANPEAILETLSAMVAGRKTYPEAARRRNAEGIVRVSMTINPDGTLRSAMVEKKSGSAILDRAALDLVRSLFPIAEKPGTAMDVAIAIEYRLAR